MADGVASNTTPPHAAISVRGVSKGFPGVVANYRVDFEATAGEVHALLGENGAGKSTLSNIISGLYRPDEGVIAVNGREVEFHSPRDALDAGIAMVHQHFRLVPSLTVAQNVVLGKESAGRFFRLTNREIEARIADLSARHHVHVEPGARVWQLSVGEQQRVEILKALYREATILILDEPTAVLAPPEAETLFDALRQMTAGGRTVIFISHKLDEVLAVADRVTVLRDGRNVATVAASEVDSRTLARLMVGRDVSLRRKPPAPAILEEQAVVIDVDGITVAGDRGTAAVQDVSLSVRKGEILGLAGVAGNGQRELAEVIAGMRPPLSGKVRIRQKEYRAHTPSEAIQSAVAYVPDDRLGTGLAPNVTIAENLVLKSYSRKPFSSGPFLRRARIRATARALMLEYDVKAPGPDVEVRLLSGGNVQKVLLAREFSSKPAALVVMSPTRGLDISATQAVRELLISIAQSGVAVLLISEDLDEIFALSDRIGVLYEGRLVGVTPREDVDVERIGLWMAGVTS